MLRSTIYNRSSCSSFLPKNINITSHPRKRATPPSEPLAPRFLCINNKLHNAYKLNLNSPNQSDYAFYYRRKWLGSFRARCGCDFVPGVSQLYSLPPHSSEAPFQINTLLKQVFTGWGLYLKTCAKDTQS